MNLQDIATAADALEGKPPGEVLEWAVERAGGRCAFATGFGLEGTVLLDFIAKERLPIDVFTLDTGLLFPETYELWRALESRYGLTIRGVRPSQSVDQQALEHGPRLWERDPDRCCRLRKVEPLRQALQGFGCWVTAIRRDQTPQRAGARTVEWDAAYGLMKVNPLLAWTTRDVWMYVKAHDVPYNRLHDRGYASIGCWPCTSSVLEGEDARAGRWRNRGKSECGIHFPPLARTTG
jgi:phosphoadenosine phosphosulfate reductase